MNEAEAIKEIAKQKEQKARDLKVDQELEWLIFGQANAKYWPSWESRQSNEWSKKLYELLGFTSMRNYSEGEGEKEFDCIEFVFPTHSFTFKISKFRSSYWDSDDDSTYGNIYLFFKGGEVASFGLIRGYNDYTGPTDPKVISVTSFIEGDWVDCLKEMTANAKSFYHWDKDRQKQERMSAEAADLKKKFGITDEDIASLAAAKQMVKDEPKPSKSFEIDFERYNEHKRFQEAGHGLGDWVKSNPIPSIGIIVGVITLLLIVNS